MKMNKSFLDNFVKTIWEFLLKMNSLVLQHPKFNAVTRFSLRLLNPRKDVLMTLHNNKVYVSTFDRMAAVIFWKTSSSARSEHDFIKKIVREGMCAVDIGSNIGYHTLQLAQCVGKTGKVYAFEPDPENYRLLVKNIEVNHYENVVAVQKAVADKSGVMPLFLCEEHRGDHRLYDSNDGRKSIDVESVTIDDFFKDLGSNIDFVKIDTQGAEGLVLSGMQDLVKSNDQIFVVCEFEPPLLTKCGSSTEEFLAKIKRLGFNTFLFNESTNCLEPVENKGLVEQYSKERRGISLFLRKDEC